ncbi:MAG: DUF4832 domain-containing protein [Propionibacteriaceae bacterium]|nr:DUF4832 domain-containing protein [Propionibacteriaceae bacterium]
MLKLRTAAIAAAAALALTAPLTPVQADTQTGWQALETTAARTDNPLKGFIPFQGSGTDTLPHQMEWVYLPLKAVVTGERTYNWDELESSLNAAKSRGKQVALRFYLDYPTRESGVPDYLLGPGGIDQSRTYDDWENKGVSFSPDYTDPRVQSLITDFVAEFGAKYDADPRIGFITTGLVGFWGEQHTHPKDGKNGNPNWMPPRDVELSFYQAWDAAFDTTKLLNRYPKADLSGTNVGFHDDSFAFSTLPTTDWHFLGRMKDAKLEDRWTTEAIGGELYPGIQLCLFEGTPCKDGENILQPENFSEAVEGTHASWLVANHLWTDEISDAALQKAKAAHASLGYDFAVTEANIETSGDNVKVAIKVTNRGVAPFYYNWPIEFSILDANGKAVQTQSIDANLPSIQPGDDNTVELSATLPAAAGTVAIRVPNAMEGGAPLKFANTGQDANFEGYLTLGSVTESPSPTPTPSASPSHPASATIGLPKTGILAPENR